MVDCAVCGTSSSVPQEKQQTRRKSFRICSVCEAPLRRSSLSRKCSRQFLQTEEYAVGGSSCVCPHLGQVTGTFAGFMAGAQDPRVPPVPFGTLAHRFGRFARLGCLDLWPSSHGRGW